MSTSSKPVATTTTNNSAPWGPAQIPLQNAIQEANTLYGNDVGYKPYTGQTQAGLSSDTDAALGTIRGMAYNQGGTIGQAALPYVQGVIGSGGISQGQQGALGILGQAANGNMNIDGSGYQNFINQAQGPSSAETNLQDYASGKNLSQPNPYLQSALEAANRQTADQVNGQFSAAGRYGSGAQTNVLSRNIGEQNTNAYMNDYEQQANRQLQANQQIDAARQGLLGVQGQGLAGLAGVQGQNIQNRLSSATGLNNAYQTGMNTALGAAMNGQQVTDQLYDPANRLAGVGSVYDTRNQNDVNAQIDQYNAAQARPWEQLGRYDAIVSGAGQLGGTQTGVQVKPGQSQLQQLLGYGSTGLGLLGKL